MARNLAPCRLAALVGLGVALTCLLLPVTRAAAADPVPVYRGQVLPFTVGLGDVDVLVDARGNCGSPAGGPIVYTWRVSYPADKASPAEAQGETFSFTVTADFDPGFIWPVDITVIGTCGSLSAFSGSRHLANYVVRAGLPPPTPGPSGCSATRQAAACPAPPRCAADADAAAADRRRSELLIRLRAEARRARAQADEALERMEAAAAGFDAIDLVTTPQQALDAGNVLRGFSAERIARWAASTPQRRDPKTGRFLRKNRFLKAGNYKAVTGLANRFDALVDRALAPTEMAKHMLASGFYAAAVVEREARAREQDLLDAVIKIQPMSPAEFAAFEQKACEARAAHEPASTQPTGGWYVVDRKGRVVTGTGSAEVLPERWQRAAAKHMPEGRTRSIRRLRASMPAPHAPARPRAPVVDARAGAQTRLLGLATLVVNLNERTRARDRLDDCVDGLMDLGGGQRAERARQCAALATEAAALARQTPRLRRGVASLVTVDVLVPDASLRAASRNPAIARRRAKALRAAGLDAAAIQRHARLSARLGEKARTAFRAALAGSAVIRLDQSIAADLDRTASALREVAGA